MGAVEIIAVQIRQDCTLAIQSRKIYFALRFEPGDFFGVAVFFELIVCNVAFVSAFCWRRISAATELRPMPRARFALLSHILRNGFFIGASNRMLQDTCRWIRRH